MTEVISGDLAEDRPVNKRQIMHPMGLRGMIEIIGHVLTEVQASGADVVKQATFVAHCLAPRFAEMQHDLEDARVQLGQAGSALAESLAVSVRLATDVERVAEALPDAERFRSLTEQRCPIGAHTGWYAPSGGKQHPCPWCLIAERIEEVERLREHIAECHRLQNNIAAVVGVDTDWDAAGRKAVLDAVCRMSGNLADAQRGASPVECAADGVEVERGPDGELLCRFHGPHPHAGLRCPDCPTCQGGAS